MDSGAVPSRSVSMMLLGMATPSGSGLLPTVPRQVNPLDFAFAAQRLLPCAVQGQQSALRITGPDFKGVLGGEGLELVGIQCPLKDRFPVGVNSHPGTFGGCHLQNQVVLPSQALGGCSCRRRG